MTDLQVEPQILLPANIKIRRPRLADLQAVTDLVNILFIEDSGEADVTTDDILTDWQRSSFNLEQDAWVAVAAVQDEAGEHEEIAAYIEVWNRSAHAVYAGDGYTHPDYRGVGIGTTLLRLVDERIREQFPLAPPDRKVLVRYGVSGGDKPGRLLLENEGCSPQRYFWRMRIDMKAPPEEVAAPDGFVFRNFIPGQDERLVFDGISEAFRDHWGYTEWRYEDWSQHRFGENFDPSLWILAFQGDEFAGGALCRYRMEDGWVDQLAVRRPWRRAGLGYALLKQAFSEFYRRGTKRVALGVDASNPTGATRLYEKAGMYVAHEFVLYEKVLRPGKDE